MNDKTQTLETITAPTLRKSLSHALLWGGAWSIFIWPDGRCEYISGFALASNMDGITKRLADENAALLYNHHGAEHVLTVEESLLAQEEDEANTKAVEKLISDALLMECAAASF